MEYLMRMTRIFGRTLRDIPADVEQRGHELVLRAGLARMVGTGSFTLMSLGVAWLRRIEALIRAELATVDAQEFLGAGNTNAVTDLVRREIDSYRRLPMVLYRIQSSLRSAARARGGLFGARERIGLDIFTLDADGAAHDDRTIMISTAFAQIFTQCGVAVVEAEAAPSAASCAARAYLAPQEAGDQTIVECSACAYRATHAIAVAAAGTAVDTGEAQPISEVATPSCETIADLAVFLGLPTAATAKAVFFDTPERGLIFVVIRGDREVHEGKLCRAAGVSELRPAELAQIRAAGAVPGYASPVGLSGVFVVADQSVLRAGPLVAGANREGYHLYNVVYGRDWHADCVADIDTVIAGDGCPNCGQALAFRRGVEIGRIERYDEQFSQDRGASYLDEQGNTRPIRIGFAGIALERLLQASVEQNHDEHGIVWPAATAPTDIHVMALGKGAEVRAAAEQVAAELRGAGQRVLLDDRTESAGVKFNDADLIGLPLRIVVSERLLRSEEIELKPRQAETLRVPRVQLLEVVDELLAGAD
jgi:prolyl-tRNA synthetase